MNTEHTQRGGSIHKVLIRRLIAMGLVISVLLGAIAWYAERDLISGKVVDRAVLGTALFNTVAQDALDAGDAAELQESLASLTSRELSYRLGRFVFFSILDRNSREVARVSDPSYPGGDAVARYIDEADLKFPDQPGEVYCETVKVAGSPHLFVASPMTGTGGEVVAYSVGMFAPSPAAAAQLRRSVLTTVFWVMAIVLVTTILLYPAILRLLRRLSRVTLDLLEANLETIEVLGSAIAMRDSDTDIHNYRVTIYSVRLGEKIGLGKKQMQGLIKGAFLHDVGKIGIRDSILLKPGRLSKAEFEIMKTHVDHGVQLVTGSAWLHDAVDVVQNHHEKVDGNGYPRGLAGTDIPDTARIFAIADVFDALTSRRPYKDPYSFEEAMGMLEAGRGDHFDSNLLDAFARIARPLYDEFADRVDDHPRRELQVIIDRYFEKDVGALISA